ncbi:unnamed protein product [Ostreobium quekettii]|uniref:ELMO domain-containing protein n=1 Tax=Ostreobium quekettii TaxID=121088 RepID=A0A8S1J1F4_9CHLO|nr:unnamed protein product [Ostreobium quekettii]
MPPNRKGKGRGAEGDGDLRESLLGGIGAEAEVGSSGPGTLVDNSKDEGPLQALIQAIVDACNCVIAALLGSLSMIFPDRSPQLTVVQGRRLRSLWQRIKLPYDASEPEQQEALERLWRASFPEMEYCGSRSPQWKEMGWQGEDPGTDFRGGGYLALQNLLYLAEDNRDTFQQLMTKTVGQRSDWEYPFAVAGVNVTFTLTGGHSLCCLCCLSAHSLVPVLDTLLFYAVCRNLWQWNGDRDIISIFSSTRIPGLPNYPGVVVGSNCYQGQKLLCVCCCHSSSCQGLWGNTCSMLAPRRTRQVVREIMLSMALWRPESLDLRKEPQPPSSSSGRGFLKLLDTSENAFEEVYVVTFELLDATWLEMKASYMEFPTVMARVRRQLEEALSKNPADVQELRRLLSL